MSEGIVIGAIIGLDGAAQAGNMSVAFGWVRWLLAVVSLLHVRIKQ